MTAGWVVQNPTGSPEKWEIRLQAGGADQILGQFINQVLLLQLHHLVSQGGERA